MNFQLSVFINRPVADVFSFLRDKEKHPQEEDSPVLLLEKTTTGAPGVGTCYREIVQMLPFYRGEIYSEITSYRENETIEEDFRGAGMHGHLAYEFRSEGAGTTLVQKEMLRYHGILRLFEPLIYRVLGSRLRDRLADIKSLLENDSSAK